MPFIDNTWKPTAKQERFLSIPDTIKEAFFGGGAGGGKSEVLLVYSIVRRWYNNPRFKQVFQRRTYQELKNEIIPRSREFYPKLGATFNKGDMAWTFPRPDQAGGSGLTNMGAMIFMGHCENEDDVHNYDSMEINLYTPDELTSFTEWIYLYVGFQRTRSSDPTLPAIIRTAGMPGDIGHTWVKKRFIDPAKKGDTIIIGRGGNKRIFIPATLADNKYIDQGYSQSLDALPEAEKQAKKFGSWEAYLGSVFDEFREKQYPDEPSNAVHVIEPFDIPDWWPRIVAIDWGYAPPAMTWVGYLAIAPSKRCYLYREQAWQLKKIEEWAPYVREIIDVEKPRVIKLCKSAGQDRGQEHTIEQQINAALEMPVELVNSSPGSRVAGKMLMHEYFRWKPRHVPTRDKAAFNYEHADWLLRNRVQDYQKYIDSFIPQEPEDLPKFQCFNTCTFFIEAIKACSYDKTNPQDVAEFAGDDAYDGGRYLIDAAERYFNESKDLFAQVKQREQIAKQLQEGMDMTAFYRKMERLEKVDKPIAVRRYRH